MNCTVLCVKTSHHPQRFAFPEEPVGCVMSQIHLTTKGFVACSAAVLLSVMPQIKRHR